MFDSSFASNLGKVLHNIIYTLAKYLFFLFFSFLAFRIYIGEVINRYKVLQIGLVISTSRRINRNVRDKEISSKESSRIRVAFFSKILKISLCNTIFQEWINWISNFCERNFKLLHEKCQNVFLIFSVSRITAANISPLTYFFFLPYTFPPKSLPDI